jgi:transcription antitermination factor NusG
MFGPMQNNPCETLTERGNDSCVADELHDLQPEPCFSNSENSDLISKFGHGGPRDNSGGQRDGAGRKPRRLNEFKPLGSRWYVAQVRAGREYQIARELIEGEVRQGYSPRPSFTVESPMIAVVGRRKGIVTTDRVQMFPGYIFIRFDRDAEDWASIRSVEGVIQIFMTKLLTPIPLPSGFVERLIESAPDRLKLADVRREQFADGSSLVVADGPLAGLAATCRECDGLTTTVALVFLGQRMVMTMPRSALREA